MPDTVVVRETSVESVTVRTVGDTVVVQDATVQIVEVVTPGPQGPPGPEGPEGPEGGHHVHVQSSPSASWVIEHNRGRLVHVTLLNASGELVEADVVESSPNVVSVAFPSPVTGSAFIS